MKISAVIIAGNEEQKIADAVRSVEWADEVIVIDSGSTDRTREIAAELGAKVIVNAWPGFSAQKQFGVETAANDWIFSLDADERVGPALQDEILRIRFAPEAELAAGYRIPRLSYYIGKPIRHGGWYPDRQLRLFDRRRARWNGDTIHESVQVQAGERVDKLSGEILHLTVDSLDQHAEMIRSRYAPLGARQMFERGKRTNSVKAATAGPIAFFQTYILKAGFLDGSAGFHIAKFAARHARMKHHLLIEMQRRED